MGYFRSERKTTRLPVCLRHGFAGIEVTVRGAIVAMTVLIEGTI
jgi:hypothetical protein